eukprot:g6435.t1
MKKHKWTVGCLKEMFPRGKVGVSESCLMGLNVNAGQEIHLRIRTDDLQGFRKYLSIREVLCHELTHMVWGDHDNNFKKLNSQLLKEVVELDWTKKGGRRLGGRLQIAPPPPSSGRSGGRRGGGGGGGGGGRGGGPVELFTATGGTYRLGGGSDEDGEEGEEEGGDGRRARRLVGAKTGASLLLAAAGGGGEGAKDGDGVLGAAVASAAEAESKVDTVMSSTDSGSDATPMDVEQMRSIRLANKAFQKRVGNRAGAVDLLRKVGWEQEGGAAGAGVGGVLRWKRNDPGLLWVARDAVEMQLQAAVAAAEAKE